MSWAVGTNVTNTITPYTPPVVPGISRSELTPSLAKRVDDYMHIVYVMDTDAGNILQTEGSWTLSPVKYHRVPIDAIPTTPLVPQTVPFHVEHGTPGGPDVTINLTALGSTQIPPWGGSFSYIITVTNTTTLAQPVDIWTMTQLPTGNWYGPILGPVAVTVPPNMNYSRTRSQFVPGTAPAGTYLYEGRVGVYPDSILDSDGFTFTKTGADQSGQGISEWLCTGEDFPAQPAEARPASFALSASPNPFNPSTMFRYELRAASYVSLMIYDTAGRLVAEPVDGWRQTGYHQATFDGSDLPSGIYFARLTVMSGSGTTPATSTQKLVLLK